MLPIFCGEGRRPREHVVHECPQGPPVHSLPVPGPGQDLGGHVLDRAAECVGHRALVNRLLAKAEISELHMAGSVKKDVLRLQVAVNNALKRE